MSLDLETQNIVTNIPTG